jgi:hypothetical protein
MTRFTFKGDVTWGSGSDPRSFEVMAQNQAGFDSFAGKAGNAVQDGVQLLENALAALSREILGSEVQRYAKRYFLTGKTLDKADADAIKVILNKTLLGMNGSTLAVKIAAKEPGNLRGYVQGTTKPSTMTYHNRVVDLDDNREWRKGAIHITGARLKQGRLGVKTLIHEATHKWAGTEDYVYFHDNGWFPLGRFKSKERALRNADSYAWFALKVGRSGGEFKSKMYA